MLIKVVNGRHLIVACSGTTLLDGNWQFNKKVLVKEEWNREMIWEWQGEAMERKIGEESYSYKSRSEEDRVVVRQRHI